MGQPTAEEQYVLELINRARANPTAEAQHDGIDLNQGLTPGTISTAAKQPLAFNAALLDAADGHSAWMLATDTFSHTGAGGSDPMVRMQNAGYHFSGSWSEGENISIRWGGSAYGAVTQSNSGALHDDLFKSAGHRENILDGSFREIGIGLAQGDYKGSPAVTVTEDFAGSGTGPFLTGVAYNDKNANHLYDVGEGLGGLKIHAADNAGHAFDAVTWNAGGYQIPVPAGTYTLTLSGAGLTQPVTRTAAVGTENVKVDLVSNGVVTAPSPTPVPAVKDTIVLHLSEDAYLGNARFKLLADGVQIGAETSVTALHKAGAWQDLSFSTLLAHTTKALTVQFTNDAWGGDAAHDRNLYVASATIDGHTLTPDHTFLVRTGDTATFDIAHHPEVFV